MIRDLFKVMNASMLALVGVALLFLSAPLSAQPTEPNVNLEGGLYIVTTSSAVSLKQLYRDTNQIVNDNFSPELLKRLNGECKRAFHEDAEYVGDVRDLDDLSLRPVCATPAPFPPMLMIKICAKIKPSGGPRGWKFAWFKPKESQFACEWAIPPGRAV